MNYFISKNKNHFFDEIIMFSMLAHVKKLKISKDKYAYKGVRLDSLFCCSRGGDIEKNL
ncbi:MAG: hypothetical protein SOU08_00600 [Anaerococcus sp.]|nr:hypothetical protein [Anaerococcus sp.]MDD7044064.1 hypothetical protein [Peptoniphilaceae bacterium]MDY2918138.1 hypothetical protein [Anaerococcus sp.]